jgi:hypothetical protein
LHDREDCEDGGSRAAGLTGGRLPVEAVLILGGLGWRYTNHLSSTGGVAHQALPLFEASAPGLIPGDQR